MSSTNGFGKGQDSSDTPDEPMEVVPNTELSIPDDASEVVPNTNFSSDGSNTSSEPLEAVPNTSLSDSFDTPMEIVPNSSISDNSDSREEPVEVVPNTCLSKLQRQDVSYFMEEESEPGPKLGNQTGSNQAIKKAPKNHIRCAHLDCKKKLGLATRYQCRCGLTFCPSHRYPESHNCSFDFKEEGRRIISHDNPLVGPKKIDEI